jgi:hypothetical protein
VPQIYAGVNGALGRHYDVVSKEEMIVFGMMRFVQGVLMTVTSICLLKFSIGLSLLRLNSNKWYRIALWCLIGTTKLLHVPRLVRRPDRETSLRGLLHD